MLKNNFSISQLLGIITSSPALFGIGAVVYNVLYGAVSRDNGDFTTFTLVAVFSLMFLVGGIGLYSHQLWGRIITTICIALTMTVLVIALLAVIIHLNDDLPLILGFIGTGLAFCSGILLFLYNYRVTKELQEGMKTGLHDEILDSHFH